MPFGRLMDSGESMRRATRPLDVNDAIRDPTRYFAKPADVLEHTDLTRDQKRRILESWITDADLLAVAEAENMGGADAERPLLREAKLALRQLGE